MSNPFLRGGLLNHPIGPENCQRMLFIALRSAKRKGVAPPGMLGSILNELRILEHDAGPSVYVLHPTTVDQLFRGVTTATYRTFRELYVDRLGRSLRTVTRVLDALAVQAQVALLSAEALWTISIYLKEWRDEQQAVSIIRGADSWELMSLHFNNCVIGSDTGNHQPTIAAVINRTHNRVLAFRIADPGNEEMSRALAVYDALVFQRMPEQGGPAGLSWTLPARLLVIGELPPGLGVMCRDLGIDLKPADSRPLLATTIESAWGEQTRATYTEKQFRLTFDTYLHRVHGFGPLRAMRQRNHQFAGLLGYNRDPAWQLPALRSVLPIHHATISATGDVAFDGLHFCDDVLTLFPDTPITLRLSQQSAATAWIYLDGEILCEAKARELRRADGTYRSARPSGASSLAS